MSKPLHNHVLTHIRGQLLLSTAELNGSSFERSVIYIAQHDEKGAMGVMLNKPMDKISFADVVRSMNIEQMMHVGVGITNGFPVGRQPIILKGGPVDNNRGFVLHSGDYKLPATIQVNHEISMSVTSEIVADIVKGQGPRQLNFCLGYAGWAPGQLEEELQGDAWLVVPADKHIVFDVPLDQRYLAATRRAGLNNLNFHGTVGQA